MWNERSLGFPWCFEFHDISILALKTHSYFQRNPRKAFSFLGACARPSTARLLGRVDTLSFDPRSSTPSLNGSLTGLLVRTCRFSLVARCTLPVCLSPDVLVEPFIFCAPDALLLLGPLLAESSGITSAEDSGLSLAPRRDEGALDFASDVAEGRLLFSAVFRAFAVVDMIVLYPLTPGILGKS